MSFFSVIGRKLSQAGRYIGKKAVQAGHFIGKKVAPVLNTISDVSGKVAKYGAMAMPVLGAIPGVGEVAAGAIGLAGAVSAGSGALGRVAGAIGAGTRAAQSRNIQGGINALKEGVSGLQATKKAYQGYKNR